MITSDTLKLWESVCPLIYWPKEQYPLFVGGGFLIRAEEINVYYFIMTNHNLSRYIPSNMIPNKIEKFKNKRWIFADNLEFEPDELITMIPDLFIGFHEIHKPGSDLKTTKILPQFIESILFPKDFLDITAGTIDENDFIIFKINFDQKLLDDEKEGIRNYYKNIIINSCLEIFSPAALEMIITSYIKEEKFLSFTGFLESLNEYEITESIDKNLEGIVSLGLHYYTTIGKPIFFDKKLIELDEDSLIDKQSFKNKNKLNGLSGSPVFANPIISNDYLQETPTPCLVGMAIRETQIIYIHHIIDMILNKKLFELRNPNYLLFK